MALDTSEMRKFAEKLKKGTSQNEIDKLAKDIAEGITAKFIEIAVKKETPVGHKPKGISEEIEEKYWAGYTGGNLRRNWKVWKMPKSGTTYRIAAINTAKYANYVELGHRQTPGKYIPHLGKRAKEPWVEGKHYNEKAAAETRKVAQPYVDKKTAEFIKKIMEK